MRTDHGQFARKDRHNRTNDPSPSPRHIPPVGAIIGIKSDSQRANVHWLYDPTGLIFGGGVMKLEYRQLIRGKGYTVVALNTCATPKKALRMVIKEY